jgi:hypothetical protein
VIKLALFVKDSDAPLSLIFLSNQQFARVVFGAAQIGIDAVVIFYRQRLRYFSFPKPRSEHR